MDMKIINSLVATCLKIAIVEEIELSLSYPERNGQHWNADCRIYDGKEDITKFVFDHDYYYVDSFEELSDAVKKTKEWVERDKRDKRFNDK